MAVAPLMSCDEERTPFVSILIPAFKEAEHIEATVKSIVQTFRNCGLLYEILIVLDVVPGDRTPACVRKIARTYPEVRVIERQGKRGVGDAIRTGIRGATGEVVIPVMGDQSENPADILRLARRAQYCDIVFTERFRLGRPAGYPVVKYVANRCCNLAVSLLFRIPYTDTTNAFKAYRRDLLSRIELHSKGFEIFLELPLKVMMLGPAKTDQIEVNHTVRKKKFAKLSVLKDGSRYVRVLISLLRDGLSAASHMQ